MATCIAAVGCIGRHPLWSSLLGFLLNPKRGIEHGELEESFLYSSNSYVEYERSVPYEIQFCNTGLGLLIFLMKVSLMIYKVLADTREADCVVIIPLNIELLRRDGRNYIKYMNIGLY